MTPAPVYPDPARRRLITGSIMLATLMVAIDGSIANVALPHIQSSLMASPEQVVWVLTSYLLATAIGTPLAGWLAQKFGRKNVLLVSILAFTIASLLCGIATNLEELVAFRVAQGLGGAALMPLSQATLFDINPPERQGKAMAVYGAGVVVGPILGPTLGGWLTDAMSWRWIFLINLPFGVLSFLGVLTFMRVRKADNIARFDLLGFTLLAVFICSLQVMLDRGQQLDWFTSPEIQLELGIALLFFFLTVVHTLTARNPFIQMGLLKDRNFMVCTFLSMQTGLIIYGVVALLAPFMERMLGYPTLLTGIASAPRGLGVLMMTLVIGQIVNKIDGRALIATGLGLAAVSTWRMAHWSLAVDQNTVMLDGFIQGLGMGMMFVPLSTLAFATLPPSLRNEGSSFFALFRSLGASIGISYLQAILIRNEAVVHSRLTEGVRPDNPMVGLGFPNLDFDSGASLAGAAGQITRQAMMVSYTDAFWLIFLFALGSLPFVLLLQKVRRRTGAPIVMDH